MLKENYNITLEQYDFLRIQQGQKCLICSREQALVVDHCHKFGHVRGLLCSNCNSGLGMFGDNISCLEMAAAYLRERGSSGPCLE